MMVNKEVKIFHNCYKLKCAGIVYILYEIITGVCILYKYYYSKKYEYNVRRFVTLHEIINNKRSQIQQLSIGPRLISYFYFTPVLSDDPGKKGNFLIK